MLFTTPLFLYIFLPLFLTAYFLTSARFKNLILIGFSLLFYFWAEPKFIAVVLVSLVADWALANAIYRSNQIRWKKFLLAVFVGINLSLLVYFKYMNFFVDNFNVFIGKLGGSPIAWTLVALPLALSFIVFEKITYGVDIYKGVGRPARTLPLYILYSLLFPKLIAGPIVKYHEIESQLENRVVSMDDVMAGFWRFSIGLARKVWVANTLSIIADRVFQSSPADLSPQQAWFGLVCYTLQIYFDFAGYSDMAIGLSRVAGFRIRENFNAPYIATSFTDFWRRWHISLSTWIKEYLYFPMGGNRVSPPRAYFNLAFCFLISGLWHGANWTFVVWGLYHGLFLALDKFFWVKASQRLSAWFNVPLTFLLVMLGWVFFRCGTLSQAGAFLEVLFRLRDFFDPRSEQIIYAGRDVFFLLIAGILCSFLPSLNWVRERMSALLENGTKGDNSVLVLALALFLFIVSILKVSTAHFEPFIYFRF